MSDILEHLSMLKFFAKQLVDQPILFHTLRYAQFLLKI